MSVSVPALVCTARSAVPVRGSCVTAPPMHLFLRALPAVLCLYAVVVPDHLAEQCNLGDSTAPSAPSSEPTSTPCLTSAASAPFVAGPKGPSRLGSVRATS